MKKKLNEVLKEALMEAKPSGKEISDINSRLKIFLDKMKKEIKVNRINAEVFVGGSFAKKTLIKKEKYDVDIFVRFDKEYVNQDISGITQKILNKISKPERIHGSRDYFKIEIEPWILFEIVPVIKVSKPQQAENITDLSYFHVRYINKGMTEKISDGIILAKSFCHAGRIYGAESHIKGFSGYSLELLVQHYKGFLPFIKAIANSGEEKIIIDAAKHYTNKRQVLMDMNSSKLESPIILVDPTFRQRNALATLSYWTFKKFRETCREFLKNPDIKFFKVQEKDFNKVEIDARKKGYDFILLRISTEMQKGAIAGSKLLKFYEFLANSMSKEFYIKEKEFFYRNAQSADCFFIAKKKEEIEIKGPPLEKKEEVRNFKKKHKGTFTKSGAVYAKEKIRINLKEFVKNLGIKYGDVVKSMYISEIEFV